MAAAFTLRSVLGMSLLLSALLAACQLGDTTGYDRPNVGDGSDLAPPTYTDSVPGSSSSSSSGSPPAEGGPTDAALGDSSDV